MVAYRDDEIWVPVGAENLAFRNFVILTKLFIEIWFLVFETYIYDTIYTLTWIFIQLTKCY